MLRRRTMQRLTLYSVGFSRTSNGRNWQAPSICRLHALPYTATHTARYSSSHVIFPIFFGDAVARGATYALPSLYSNGASETESGPAEHSQRLGGRCLCGGFFLGEQLRKASRQSVRRTGFDDISDFVVEPDGP